MINIKNNKIIFDLNLSLKTIKSLVLKYSPLNTICVCGTSAHKVYKIKNLLPKINILILNKQESLNLSNKKNIKDALKFIITKNKNLTAVITNGKNFIKAYHNKNTYICKPPKTTIYNENKAGDIMSAFFYYYFFQKLNFASVLSKSIAAGSLHVSGFNSTKTNYLKMIDKLSENIKVRIKKSVR
jgi:fructose-1-phosphate kinase PfkB-like protein